MLEKSDITLCYVNRMTQTKGRVEQAVRFDKEQFLDGREYCGIDT